MVQRFASNMVFMALLLGSDVAVLFSPSNPSEIMRQRLVAGEHGTLDFWAGLFVCISMFLCLCTILATFTAWAIISAVSGENAHCVIRSSIGLHATQLPSRIIVAAIYSFVVWAILFMFILVPLGWAIAIVAVSILVILHIVSTYSALGRLVMYTSAMSNDRIFELRTEETMLPFDLLETLVDKSEEERKAGTPVTEQYRREHVSISRNGALPDLESGVELRQRKEKAQDSSQG
mmetsp:Transcript_48576/g.146501  ORF Transcript_48576/g.146501 Transcript_48576/m.146501 type:complete len:234 (+) Transcript_48576:636-1337(+)